MAEKQTESLPYLRARLGLIGELIVQKVAVQYVDFCFRTCTGHPADLIIDHGGRLYRVNVKTRTKRKIDKKMQYLFEFTSKSKIEKHKNYPIEICASVYMPEGRVEFHATNTMKYGNYTTDGKHLTEDTERESLQKELDDLNINHSLNVSDYIAQ